MKTSNAYRRIKRLCEGLGGKMIPVTRKEFEALFQRQGTYAQNGYEEAPFTSNLGIHWERKELYWIPRGTRWGNPHSRAVGPGEMIHELGHIFGTTKSPSDSNEMDFLGWEWVAARATKVEDSWLFHMGNYGVGDDTMKGCPYTNQAELRYVEFESLSGMEKQWLLDKCLREGKECGNISSEGKPLSVR